MTKKTSDLKFDDKQFSSQTEDLNHLLIKFQICLEQEALAIRSNNIDNLTSTLNSKQNIVKELESASNLLEKNLNTHSLTIITLTQSELFKTFPTALKNLTMSTIKLIEECHDKNLANGMSVQTLSSFNQHALDLISGKNPKNVKLYNATGEKTLSANSSTSLGKA